MLINIISSYVNAKVLIDLRGIEQNEIFFASVNLPCLKSQRF